MKIYTLEREWYDGNNNFCHDLYLATENKKLLLDTYEELFGKFYLIIKIWNPEDKTRDFITDFNNNLTYYSNSTPTEFFPELERLHDKLMDE